MPDGEQKQTTTIKRSPQYEDFMGQIFGQQQGGWLGGLLGGQTTPGVGLQGLEQIFGPFQPNLSISPLQRQATNQLGQYMGQNPEIQAYNLAMQGLSPILTGQGQFGNVAEAAFPVFQRGLTEGMAQLGSAAPGRFGSAFLQQGTDLSGRAIQDYNLFVEQARQQDIANRMQAGMTLGTLASSAGMNPYQRALGAGQFGLGVSQFMSQPSMIGTQNRLAMQQQLLQMLSNPTGQTTTSQYTPGFYDWMQLPFQAAGAYAGMKGGIPA